ncbi:MAG: Ppx/GppA family phosphatase, partial [Novosphingobium sp.]
MRKRWVGIDSAGRAALAAALQANTGEASTPAPWLRLAGPQTLFDARAIGLAARLGRRLSACSPGVLGKTRLTCENGRLTI